MATPQKKTVSKLSMPHRHLLGIDHLSADDINAILDLADYYVVQNRRKSQGAALLKGCVAASLFLENSTRTRLSFDMAIRRLGGEIVHLSPESSSLNKGESFEDTLKTVGAMRPDIVIIRDRRENAAALAAEYTGAPVINAGDGTREHPTQALLDALTLRRHFGRIEGLHIAILGDVLHSRVAHSNMHLLKKLGASFSAVGPQALMPAGAAATEDMATGLKNADAVMVLRLQRERFKAQPDIDEKTYFERFGLTPARLAAAKSSAVVLHPGPMNRGVEIDSALADDPARSLITTQVEMGVAVRMACLDLLTRRLR